jgi:uncharacterized protein (TIGR02147 family)
MQRKMAHLAADALDTVPKEKRDISGVSVSIASDSLKKISDEIQQCRRRIMEIAANDTNCDSVYRINFHLFPVSEIIPEKFRKHTKEVGNNA